MLFKQIQKKDILRQVKKAVSSAKKEILATMRLKEEMENPLPASYFNLLNSKINEGIVFKRLGFGEKEDYNSISKRHNLKRKNFEFKYFTQESKYQRLIIIDKKELFFGINNTFFESKYKPLIKIFSDYFFEYFRKGNRI